MPQILIGYAAEDVDDAVFYADALREIYDHWDVWYDDVTKRGQPTWKRRLSQQFPSAKVVVILLSQAALRSRYCIQLLKQSAAADKHIILAVMQKGLSLEGVPPKIRTLLKAQRRVLLDHLSGPEQLLQVVAEIVPPAHKRAKSSSKTSNKTAAVAIVTTSLVGICGFIAFIGIFVVVGLNAAGMFDPSPIDVSHRYIDEAVELLNAGHNDEAIAKYTQAIEVDPYTHAHAYSERGWAYINLELYDLALADFDMVIQIDETYENAYDGRGYAYMMLERYHQAENDYDVALRLESNNIRVMNHLGMLYRRTERYEDAYQLYTQTIQLDGTLDYLYNNRGFTAFEMGDCELAITDYNRALQLEPKTDDGLTFNNRAICYRELGEYDLAMADHNAAIAADPTYHKPYAGRGLTIATATGDYEAAIAEYQYALSLEPDYPDGLMWLGDAYYALGDYPAALATYEEYGRVNGKLEPEMLKRIAEMEAAGS